MNNLAYHFCTITTNGYLFKSLALYESLCKQTDANFHLWICTIDNAAYELLIKLNLPAATIIAVEEIENSSLIEAKNNRYKNEYCWTIKASLTKYIFKRDKSIDAMIYVDSDTFFFSNPGCLFESLFDNDILLTSHNFTQGFSHLNGMKGKYNAGIVGFRNNKYAMHLLNWWENKCINWCYNQVIPNKFADQKYLETIGDHYPRAAINKSLGVNTAMWNIDNRAIEKEGDKIYIDRDLLTVYHFSSFVIISENEFDLWNSEYSKPNLKVRDYIYSPYVNAIMFAIKQANHLNIDISDFLTDSAYCTKFYNHFIVS